MRIMGLDVGEKRIGVAISDPFGWTAVRMFVLEVDGQDAVRRLGELIREEDIEKVVIGLPRNMNGTDSEQTRKVREFAKALESMISIPMEMWDERLSTVAATKSLLEADLTRARRKKVVDGVAASLILQSYLDSRRSR